MKNTNPYEKQIRGRVIQTGKRRIQAPYRAITQRRGNREVKTGEMCRLNLYNLVDPLSSTGKKDIESWENA